MPGNMMRVSWTVRSCLGPAKPGTSRLVSGSARTTPTTLMAPVSAASSPAMAPARWPASWWRPSARSRA